MDLTDKSSIATNSAIVKQSCMPQGKCCKCGQEATVDHVKFSGPWALIKLSCPTHGNKLHTHKIWSSDSLTSLMRELQHLNRFNHNLFQAKKKGFDEIVARDTRMHIKKSAKIAVQNVLYELKLLPNR